MDREKLATYPPLNTLKAVASEVWIVDGPIIRFGLPWLKLSFPTRMTAIYASVRASSFSIRRRRLSP